MINVEYAIAKDIKEDLLFAERVEKAWQEHDKGKFLKKSKEDFLKLLKVMFAK